ncbi:hypothetical protein LMG27952_00535 [Paraburkholderia hiiakae]|uniref:WAP domain-containing protein n=1 Tax=Paraburkholderia hiiakae TaxID=1081782 RepID=A0ABN7HEI1_9BURK|nr:hypothetical protein LMG27952_00535 [Paraburkholderia hiiakae]
MLAFSPGDGMNNGIGLDKINGGGSPGVRAFARPVRSDLRFFVRIATSYTGVLRRWVEFGLCTSFPNDAGRPLTPNPRCYSVFLTRRCDRAQCCQFRRDCCRQFVHVFGPRTCFAYRRAQFEAGFIQHRRSEHRETARDAMCPIA